MNDKLKKYLDEVFLRYEDVKAVRELKEELYVDLQDRFNDLKSGGLDDEAALERTVASIGDISELVDGINVKTTELQQFVGMNLSGSNLQKSDLRGVSVHDGKFNYSNMQGSDFSNADLRNSSFKCSNLDNCKFDGANLSGAKINKSNLTGATFCDAVLHGADFGWSNLNGAHFDNLTLNGTIFQYSNLKGASFRNTVLRNVTFKSELKKAVFDGATMDKLTYALLKGYKAKLTNVTVI